MAGVGLEIGKDIESCCELRYQVKYAVSASLVGREGGGIERTGTVPLNADKDRNRKSCGIECVESTLQ